MQLIVVFQADDVLILVKLAFEEKEFLVFASPLSRRGHIFQQLPRNIDVMLDLVSHAAYDRLLQSRILVSSALLHIAKLVHLVNHIG